MKRALLAVSIVALASRSVLAQQLERPVLGVAGGVSLLGRDAFAQAFDQGPSVRLMATVHLVGRLSMRVGVGHDWFPYDRPRLFRTLGLDSVDLDSQLGGDAQLTTWSVGPEVTLWRTLAVRVYSFGSVGRVSRSTSTGPLVSLYCDPPSAGSPGVAPAGCAQAVAETDVAGAGTSLAIGTGIQWRYRPRALVSLEVGFARSFL